MKKSQLVIRGLVVICATVLAVGSVLAAGKTFYVDAVHGNDAWTGTADWEHRDETTDPVTGPRRSLSGVTALVTGTSDKATVGDTVYVAEGDYNSDAMSTGGASPKNYRLIMKSGMRLIGTGDRNKTLINGNSEIPVLNIAGWCLVKNVTICNGSSPDSSAWVGGGNTTREPIEPISRSFVVGCVVSNCVATGTAAGGAVAGAANAASIRNLFVRNYTAKTGNAAVYSGFAWNCIYDQGDDTKVACSNVKSYNCTFLNCSTANAGGKLYNCLVLSKEGNSADLHATVTAMPQSKDSTVDAASQINQGLDRTQIDGNWMPVSGANVGIDRGVNDNWTTNRLDVADYPMVADEWDLDFWGNPRIVGGTIDCGAVEFSPELSNFRSLDLTLTAAKGGVTLTGAEPGVTVVGSAAENIAFSIARDYAPAETDPTKFCLGVNINGEFFSFTGADADRVYERAVTYGGTSAVLVIEAVYATTNNWYVNPNVGKGSDANDGYTPYRAKRTLKGAVTNTLLRAGDVIHAAAGTYAEETMTDRACGNIRNRVVVPADVWLVADEGPERTVILGEKDNGGCGPNAVRCVAIEYTNAAYVRGFTLTGGATGTEGTYAKCAGGGFSKGGYFIGCVVTNNHAAAYSGGVYGATTIGCYYRDNYSGTGADDVISVNFGRHFNAVLDATSSSSANALVNCLLLPNAKTTNCKFVANTAICTSSLVTSCTLYDCLLDGAVGKYCKVEGRTEENVEGLADMFDANFRPKAGTKPVDFGVNLSYETNCPAVFADLDFAGGQRIYNGTIDCGAGEFDWRGTYAKVLGGKQSAVEAVSSNVVTADDLKSLALGADAVLRMTVLTGVSGMCSFSPSGTVSVKLNGNELAPIADEYSFEVESGSPAALEISAVGSDVVTLTKFSLPKSGLMLLFR